MDEVMRAEPDPLFDVVKAATILLIEFANIERII
jgi:hypothetical protein